MRNCLIYDYRRLAYFSISRSKSVIIKHTRRSLCVRHYGTSSKPTTNPNEFKESIFKRTKAASDNLISLAVKSVTVAASILKPLISLTFVKKKQPGKHPTEEKDSFKLTLKNTVVANKHNNLFHSHDNSLYSDFSHELRDNKLSPEKVSPERSSSFEQAILEWIAGGNLQDKRKEFLDKDDKKSEKLAKPTISKLSIEHRSRFLVQSFNLASSPASKLLRLEEICKHLILFPEAKSIMVKEGLIRSILWSRYRSSDKMFNAQARVALSLLGHHDPPQGDGIRILSIDGGGIRGLMTIEILRQLETRTGKKIYQLFDYMCGVSSGAILSLLLGGLHLSLDECEKLYIKLSSEVFKQSTIWGTGRLVWSHAYYDTTMWVKMLRTVFEDDFLVDTMKKECNPKLGAISTVMNLPSLQPFIFRNYNLPVHLQSHYLGSSSHKMWESIRASGAAPGYFEEYCLGDYLHQDGGVMVNNPAAVSIHETRLLWPSDYIQCIFSLGSGRYIPATHSDVKSTSLKTKVLKIIDSATDTEGVHVILNDLLPPNTYFRFNPYLTEFLSLDEIRSEKLHQLKVDAQMYLRRNEEKFNLAVDVLTKPRTTVKRIHDWIKLQGKLLF